MTQEDVIEGDFIISKFIGFNYSDSSNEVFKICHWELHNYSEDWNLLMAAVQKIGEIYNRADEQLFHAIRVQDFEILNLRIVSPSIKVVWIAVVEFLKWLNENK